MLATKLSANSYAGLKLGTASAITPRIFLSDYFTARDEKVLNSLGITHVVSIIEQDPDIPTCIPEDNKMWISLADTPTADILAHLASTTSFITEALDNPSNKVLVRPPHPSSQHPVLIPIPGSLLPGHQSQCNRGDCVLRLDGHARQ